MSPLIVDDILFGAIELISYEQALPEAMLEALQEIAELASPALAAARSYEPNAMPVCTRSAA
jgi:GAF domain-containing protein